MMSVAVRVSVWLAAVIVTAACGNPGSNHPALGDAVEAHIEAVGGRSALESLIVIERQGRFVLGQGGNEYAGSYRTCLHYPESVAIAIDAGPVQVHQVLGEHGALTCAAGFTECEAADEDMETELRETARMANREQLYMELPGSAYDVTESPDEVLYAYRLDGVERAIAFDKHTGLIRSLRRGSKVRELGDWRNAGSVMLPFSIRDEDPAGGAVTISLSYAVSNDAPSDWCRQAFATGAM